MHPLRIGVCYDFRNPPDSGIPDQTLYDEVMEQVKWLDEIGADLVIATGRAKIGVSFPKLISID